MVRSATAMALTSEVSLMSETSWLVSGGNIRRTACGRITSRSVFHTPRPRLMPASHCARGTDCRPARNSSAMYAPSNRPRASTAAPKGPTPMAGANRKYTKNN